MKIMLVSVMMILSFNAVSADIKSMYLTTEDQKYFKNDSFDGNNQRERIDANVKEINKLMGEVASMKADIQSLKSEIEELKKAK